MLHGKNKGNLLHVIRTMGLTVRQDLTQQANVHIRSQHLAYLDSYVVVLAALVFAKLRLTFLYGDILQEVSVTLCLRALKTQLVEERHHLQTHLALCLNILCESATK